MYSLWLPLRGTLSFQNFRVLTTFMAINETTTSTMMSASENCERFSTVITFAHILVILPMWSAFLRAVDEPEYATFLLSTLLHPALLLLLVPCVLMATSCPTQYLNSTADSKAKTRKKQIWSNSRHFFWIFGNLPNWAIFLLTFNSRFFYASFGLTAYSFLLRVIFFACILTFFCPFLCFLTFPSFPSKANTFRFAGNLT